ncbi:protein kinase [Streptacidiphilus sp. EB129]|uniref:protein kinase domain-containing protein n=1 Tax=Streptacidiphilus sp. EB129 TaxID=3156262 RepID=UPI003512C32C
MATSFRAGESRGEEQRATDGVGVGLRSCATAPRRVAQDRGTVVSEQDGSARDGDPGAESTPVEGAAAGGQLLAGRYRLVERIGRGGMGTVWRAEDRMLDREVAVKELAVSGLPPDELATVHARMKQEARAAGRIKHTGVVTIYDVLEQDGRPWIVMELVDGRSLAEIITTEGTLLPRDAARVGAQVLAALEQARHLGVLHRDVKPANVLLERAGRVVLTDFGIATIEGSTALTHTGDIVGSPDYLAPERATGHRPGPESDLWSLGATLYAAVEGQAPFHRTSTLSTLQAVIAEPLPEPRHAGKLAPVIEALLRKDPDERPGADEAMRMLQEVATGAQPTAGAQHDPTQVVPSQEPERPETGARDDRDRFARYPTQSTPATPYPDPYGGMPAAHPQRTTGKSGADRRAGRMSPRVSVLWALVPLLTLGMGTMFVVGWAAYRLRSLWLAVSAVVALTVTVIVFTLNGSGPAGGLIVLVLMGGGLGVTLSVRRRLVAPGHRGRPRPLPGARWARARSRSASRPGDVDPTIGEALKRRQRRLEARDVLEHDPALARELRIGRPDLPRQFDDGGLVDVNHVPVATLAAPPGLTPELAERVVQARDEHGGFAFLEEMDVYAHLPDGLAQELAERLVFLQ